MITLQLLDLKVIKQISFVVVIDPTPWAMGIINSQPSDELTKTGNRKKVRVGEDPAAAEFKESFSKQAVGHRISNNSPLYKDTPVFVCFDFFMSRPKSLKTGPALPMVRPDLTNMHKLTEDVLTGLFWADDNTTVSIFSSKRYVSDPIVKPYIVTSIHYCEMIRPAGGFEVKQKG